MDIARGPEDVTLIPRSHNVTEDNQLQGLSSALQRVLQQGAPVDACRDK